MDRLELRRVALYPGGDDESEAEGILILVGHFNVPAGLRAAETALSELQVCWSFCSVILWCLCSIIIVIKLPI